MKMHVIAALSCASLVGATFIGISPVAAGDVSTNFSRCAPGTIANVPVAPRATGPANKPTGSRATVGVSQFSNGAYQQVGVRVGNQQFPMLLDTGSSWMVINHKAIANNPRIRYTGQRAAVAYGGGQICVAGLVARGPVSLGGLRPRVMTFLVVNGGTFPYTAIFGINTWRPPSSFLSVPVNALRISEFQLRMTQRTFDPTARGALVLNGQPAINTAPARNVLTFNNRALVGGNRIYVPGWLVSTTGKRAPGSFMLDIGTPYNNVALFGPTASALGYNFARGKWPQPNARIRLIANPSNARAGLMPIDGPATQVSTNTLAFSVAAAANPRAGLLGLAGTQAVLGADYVRPWVLGVRFTPTGSVVRLLKR